jgi:YVTN family beta-propeller protein
VVTTVVLGDHPYGVGYDSGAGQVIVANQYSNDVSVFTDATNTVVATVEVGNYPVWVVYDSAKGEIFIPNLLSVTVSVISDGTS